ncbi:MAG TPA: hypothetical protein VGH38_11760 [Bryobacteraceae bacterium]|jgi:hypothetical protein
MEQTLTESVALGVRIGRGQAFACIAYKSLAAQAQALMEVKESGSYKLLGLDWEQYCPQHAGLSRRQVDSLIDSLKEFGATYYRLKELINISPETYRRIAPQIQDDCLEIEGELVPIAPENAIRIREAVTGLRSDLRKARESLREANKDIDILTTPELAGLQSRLDSCFYDLRMMAPGLVARKEHTVLRAFVQHASAILNEISNTWLHDPDAQ